MRNLKKILALVLALVMALSLMTVASAKSIGEYTDGASVSPEYAHAVDFTTQLGVLQGMSATSYAPKGTLTRAQLATMIYRITTGDVAGAYVNNYAAGVQFDDAKGHWAAGYIAYCADAGYLKGVGNNKYNPNGELTGYAALAALLRAIGYNANNDFTGSDWTVKVAEVAYSTKIVEGVYTNLAGSLTREQAAQLVYNALWTSKVAYTAAFGYSTYGQSKLVHTALKVATGKAGIATDRDAWGRPCTNWYYTNGKTAVTVAAKALNQYTTATSECLIAIDMGLQADTYVDVWTNGSENAVVYDKDTGLRVSGGEQINLKSVANTVGAQGTLVEVYADRLVIIDTYLGFIGTAHPATFDINGHQLTPNYTDVYVYDKGYNKGSSTITVPGIGYTAGQAVLVNKNADSAYNTVLGAAQGVVGAQSYVYSDNARTVAGTKYPAATHFYADATKKVVSTTNYTWYFDQYGNVIGDFIINTVYNHGVIEAIQWINPELSNGYALATIRYMNNTTANVKVAKYLGKAMTYTTKSNEVGMLVNDQYVVSTSLAENVTAYVANQLFAIEDLGNGTVALTAVDSVTGNVKTGVSKIGTLSTDNATIYMIFNGKTFDYYTGYTSVVTLKGEVKADYVMNEATNYAKYVYVKGSAADTQVAALVQVKDAGEWFYDNATTNYTLTDAYVGGVLTPVVVNSTEFAKLADNTVYYVTYTNGVVTATTAINATGWTSVGGSQVAKILTVESVSGVDVVKTTSGTEWNVEKAAVYGEVKVGAKIVVVAIDGTATANTIFVIG